MANTTENSIRIFENPEFGQVRTTLIEGEPWFVGKDIASVLGYTNPQKAIRDHVDVEDRTVNESFTVNGTPISLINESGLYSLVLSSKLPTAKAFKRWVTLEVLPSIRKTGLYAAETVTSDMMFQLAKAMQEKEQRIAALQEENGAQAKQLEEAKPKVQFADAVSTSNTCILIGELAKLLKGNGIDIGQNRLFTWLREHGFLIARKGTDYNAPTQRAMNMGLFKVKETAVTHTDGSVTITKTTKVTGKGQQYFIRRFLNEEE